MKGKLRVTNIQRMCFHDGPGIRTTVFLKGCSLHCPWCSNPENIEFFLEEYEEEGVKSTCGRDYDTNKLIEILMKDRKFWDKEGGVTFSGGEALMQAEALQMLLKQLKSEDVHTAVETALFVPSTNLDRVISYIDYFIVDVKILNRRHCKEVLGGDTEQYLKNVETLYRTGRLKLFRVPCCPEYTFTEENKRELLNFFKEYADIPVQIFEIHRLGEKKYESLKRPMWKSSGLEEEDLYNYRNNLKQQGINVDVIYI